LSKEQKDAILKAHNIWNRLENWNYSIWDLKKKVKILQKAWFDNHEIRILLDKWICWTEYPKFKILYENPRYNFLEKYKDILGEKLSEKDIIWEWNNWIILKHPSKNDKVLKIAKQWNVDSLEKEFENHYLFERWLDKLKKELWWTKWYEKIKGFYIPKIEKYKWIEWLYQIERINWLSLKSIVHLEFNKANLIDVPSNLYNWFNKSDFIEFFSKNWASKEFIEKIKKESLTDNDIISFLREKWLKVYPDWNQWFKEKNKSYVEKFIRTWFTNEFYKKEITPFNDILKENWFYHNDIHWWNYMIWTDWKKYMIDFWNSEYKK
jgi:hypothetical protein